VRNVVRGMGYNLGMDEDCAKMPGKKRLWIILGAVALMLVVGGAGCKCILFISKNPAFHEKVKVLHVMNGNTFFAEGKDKYFICRFEQIAVPKIGEFGFDQSKAFLKNIVSNKRILIYRPFDDSDSYDQEGLFQLWDCFALPLEGEVGPYSNSYKYNVAYIMVKNGWANYLEPPGDAARVDFLAAQENAKLNGLGIWKK